MEFLLISLYREGHSGYDIGLKPILEGSIPSFIILVEHRLDLQMFDMEEGIHVIIQCLLK